MEAEGVCEGMLSGLSQGSAWEADGDSANQHQIHNVLQLRGGGESSSSEEGSIGESSAEKGSVSDGERVAASPRISSEDVDDEPDENAGRITGVPLDMDAECDFDEVEFGDGDKSHHNYSHMSGINITWIPREEDMM
ncbi:MAG: hypothetical protein ACKPKO_57485, partial [Candidatus Fonsibacter sp.]